MSEATTLTDEQRSQFMRLIRDADSVELKLTIPDSQRIATMHALDMDPLEAQIRQVFFFDTPTSRSIARASCCGLGGCRGSATTRW